MPTQIDHRHVVRLLAIGRVALGAASLALPGRVGRAWLGPGGGGPATRVIVRSLGARDLVLGLGTLRALDTGDPGLRGWVELTGTCDLVDAVATSVARERLGPRRVLATGLAAGAAAAAYVAKDRLD